MSARRLAALVLALFATLAVAQEPLKLPRTQGEVRSLLRETNDPMCLRCGVVTSLRAVDTAGPGMRVTAQPIPGISGVDSGVTPVPVGGSERAKAERNSMLKGPEKRYEVIVRYDDGTVGRVDLENDPGLKRGDRVKVDGNTIRRYP